MSALDPPTIWTPEPRRLVRSRWQPTLERYFALPGALRCKCCTGIQLSCCNVVGATGLWVRGTADIGKRFVVDATLIGSPAGGDICVEVPNVAASAITGTIVEVPGTTYATCALCRTALNQPACLTHPQWGPCPKCASPSSFTATISGLVTGACIPRAADSEWWSIDGTDSGLNATVTMSPGAPLFVSTLPGNGQHSSYTDSACTIFKNNFAGGLSFRPALWYDTDRYKFEIWMLGGVWPASAQATYFRGELVSSTCYNTIGANFTINNGITAFSSDVDNYNTDSGWQNPAGVFFGHSGSVLITVCSP